MSHPRAATAPNARPNAASPRPIAARRRRRTRSPLWRAFSRRPAARARRGSRARPRLSPPAGATSSRLARPRAASTRARAVARAHGARASDPRASRTSSVSAVHAKRGRRARHSREIGERRPREEARDARDGTGIDRPRRPRRELDQRARRRVDAHAAQLRPREEARRRRPCRGTSASRSTSARRVGPRHVEHAREPGVPRERLARPCAARRTRSSVASTSVDEALRASRCGTRRRSAGCVDCTRSWSAARERPLRRASAPARSVSIGDERPRDAHARELHVRDARSTSVGRRARSPSASAAARADRLARASSRPPSTSGARNAAKSRSRDRRRDRFAIDGAQRGCGQRPAAARRGRRLAPR